MSVPVSGLSVSERALLRVDTVVGKYRIVRLIGVGGMAAVYAATHRNGHRVAIKFLLERHADDPEILQLFRREAYAANRVGHPGAVPVLDDDEDENGCAFLVMPLLQGETVRALWDRENKRLPVSDVGVLMADVLAVLASAHANGVVHRDIKPDNLFITTRADVRVLDFGIARRIDVDSAHTLTGRLVGTPAFMPPEQALGDRAAVGPGSDLWAVGATIFALLSGEFVHVTDNAMAQFAAAATRHARSLAAAAPGLPASVVDFVDKSLAFDPKDRWQSAVEMRDALLATFELALGEPVSIVAPRVRERLAVPPSSELDETLAKGVASTGPKPAPQPSEPKPAPQPSEPKPAAQSTGLKPVARAHEAIPEVPVAFGALSYPDPPRSLREDVGGATFPRVIRRLDSRLEVRTAGRHFAEAFRLSPGIIHRLLVKHGLGRFASDGRFMLDLRTWWPMDAYTATVHEISEAIGPAKMVEIGKLVAKLAVVPPTMHDLRTTLAAIDAAYHLNHRKDGVVMFDMKTGRMLDGIGHAHYLGDVGKKRIAMEWDGPYPCDMDRGILLGFARLFEPASFIEHSPDECRKEGAPSCIYYVSW